MPEASAVSPPRGAALPSSQPARLGAGWLLWILLLTLGWLLPAKFPPWLTFDLEITMVAASMTLAGGLILTSGVAPWRIPLAAVPVLLLAAVPLLQWLAGLVTYLGDAALASLYLLALAGAIVCAHRAYERLASVWLDAFFGAIVLAAVLSTALALYQWLGLSGLGQAATKLSEGARPYANFGQPNHLATLLGWGLMGLWWHWQRGKLPGWVATGLAAFVLVGVASTQSRTAWLFMALIAVGAAVFHRPLDSRRAAPVLLGLALGFILLVSQWERIDAALGLQVAHPLEDRLKASRRLPNWQMLIDGLSQQPWFGYGWQQVHAAQQAAVLDHPKTLEALDHSHNLVLDLLIWNGVPLGALLVVLGFVWWWRTGAAARRQSDPAAALVFLALSVSLVHAMLEYPHSYAYFLIPAGLMVGSLCALTRDPASGALLERSVRRLRWPEWSLPRWAVGCALVLAAATVVVINRDYRAARAQLEAQRFEIMNMVNPNAFAPGEAPVNHTLTQLRDFLDPPRAVIGVPPSAERLEQMRRFALRYPQRDSMMEYAKAQAQVGDFAGASLTMRRMCHLSTDERCEELRQYWAAMVKGNWPILEPVRF